MICQNCGGTYTSQRQHGRYCSNGCKKSAARGRADRNKRDAQGSVTKGRFARTCAYCGKEYRSASPRGRYCSNACKQAAYRVRKEKVKA
jgi:hypothetical protein